jgi:hypothetical protein
MYSLKRKASDDYREVERPKQKTHKWNPKYEEVKSFLENYFAPENGRCEKLPNPRYGRDEYRLPIWLTKVKVYCVYVADAVACKSKYLTRNALDLSL